MKLSNRSIYGLRAMFDLAYHGSDGPIQIREIAERAQIPLRFLEQIFQFLKRAQLVTSKRGPKGGYLLSRSPDEITLAMVFDALEDLPQMQELPVENDSDENGHMTGMVADQVCCEIFEQIRGLFEQFTVADLVHRGEELGLPRACYERFVYVI